MNGTKNITKDIYYVGVNDHNVDLFEGQYVVPNGMAYNSYVIVDEKVAVFDTVSAGFGDSGLLSGVVYQEGTALTVSGRAVKFDAGTGVYTLRVSNKAGYELPSTGGTGWRYAVLGWILLMGAATGLVLRWRSASL